ncbi:MAG: hypothetical protein V7K69_29385 [Nostoc sp.]|uniref:hypothetical protein n=1 Tax=Nostoc sp. TaxID=1180 RepID=UPI002FFA55D7
MSIDNVCRYLSEQYPESFATWLLGRTPANVKDLKTEQSHHKPFAEELMQESLLDKELSRGNEKRRCQYSCAYFLGELV